MKKIKAIFKGANGSLGYQTGKQYDLLMQPDGEKIFIMREGYPEGNCIYDGITPFFDNWTDIQT